MLKMVTHSTLPFLLLLGLCLDLAKVTMQEDLEIGTLCLYIEHIQNEQKELDLWATNMPYTNKRLSLEVNLWSFLS